MTVNDTILLATRNRGKIQELTKMLAPFRLKVVGLEAFPDLEDVEETGATFEENALLKARYASVTSGLVAVADDSGLMVDALDGAPGIYSARFSLLDEGQGPNASGAAGEEFHATLDAASTEGALSQLSTDERNNLKLLRLLEKLPGEERGARFCSALAAVAPTGQSITSLGLWEGVITSSPRGENGFGYDPLFLDPELGLTAAQMSPYEKNQRSHRARAMAALAGMWPRFWADFLASLPQNPDSR